eukprot:CAMPEP_0172487168 /NCGR_PEP_ID=MMETSP1066-20121228/16114_1 /TAXON_ID=671091 /ORGANISM="Coscinodiscus wailesii, Strain CCMP2513" /LENGTH=575 /DNA_ID=CAMNT_0013253599 /DNA_START=196 /DNA_END=1923 /DNA_ORIENTATION=-
MEESKDEIDSDDGIYSPTEPISQRSEPSTPTVPLSYKIPSMTPEAALELEENTAFAHESPLIRATSKHPVLRASVERPAKKETTPDTSNDNVVNNAESRSSETASDKALMAAAINSADDTPPAGIPIRDQQEDALIRVLAGQLKRDWKNDTFVTPNLERRLRDFQFAQQKRKEKYGNSRPWGILGLYDHLAAVRVDVEWAEDAAWRRENGEPYFSWSDFDENKAAGFNKPFFTYILLLICTGCIITSIGLNGWKIEPMSINPMIGPSAETLVRMGAKKTDLIVIEGEWYRLFTPMFLHAGAIHYILNMLALWFIGSAVEQCHGFVAATILFVIPAVGGTILSAIFLPEYISVGASGGIFGLIGACIADIAMNWSLLFSRQLNSDDSGRTLRHVRILVFLLMDIAVNCLLGLTPFVDNFTHLGGMVYGFLCGLSTMERLPTDFFGMSYGACDHVKQVCIRFAGLILSVAAIMVTTAVLAESDGITSPCPACRYLSCAPFPPWAPEDKKWWYCDDCGMVTADARRNNNLEIFDELTLVCPDGAVELIDITSDQVGDKDQLAGDLPKFCRNYCNNHFA